MDTGALQGKVALITGGAKGIGAAATESFACEGAKVLFMDVDQEGGAVLEQRLTDEGHEITFCEGDVARDSDVRDTVARAKDKHGRFDIIYNNASVFLPDHDGMVTDIEPDIWEKVLDVNLKSIYLLCRHGVPLMITSGGGSIINTSSSAGVVGIPRCDAYTASKGATVSLTRSMAVEYGHYGIRVNCIAPAAINTAMLGRASSDGPFFDEQRFLKLRCPMRRYGTAQEVANLAVFLASDKASFITGAVIPVDGGVTISGDLAKIRDE